MLDIPADRHYNSSSRSKHISAYLCLESLNASDPSHPLKFICLTACTVHLGLN